MAVTLKQIAERSGLSLMTISYVLNEKGHLFRPETRERVWEAAETLGYLPNSSARAMRQGRFNSVALVISDTYHRSVLSQQYLTGIQTILSNNGLHLTLSQLPDQKLTDERFLPKILRESMSDGMLIHYIQEIPPMMVELIERHHLPAVWTNVRRASDCVHPDDLGAGRMVTEHLVKLGHRRIAYVDGVHVFEPNHERQDHYSAADRYEGYCQVMREAGLTPRLLSERTNLPTSRIAELMVGWLSEPDRPTALVTYGSRETEATVLAAAWKGLAVPRDLSIVTFNNQPLDVGRPITTALIPERETGAEATKMLLRRIADPTRPAAPQALPFELSPCLSSLPPAEPRLAGAKPGSRHRKRPSHPPS
jgi:LacI family transcriptional regulator